MPALFTRMSSPPNSRDRRRDRSLPFSLRRHIEMDVDRAAAVCVDFPGYLGPGLAWISVTKTAAPSLANRLAVAAPTPLADPVTRATRPREPVHRTIPSIPGIFILTPAAERTAARRP